MLGSSLRCPHCGTSNPRDQRVCLKCARSLTTEDAFASSTGNVSSAPVAFNTVVSPPVGAVSQGVPPSYGLAPGVPSAPGIMPSPVAPGMVSPVALGNPPLPAFPLPLGAMAQPVADGAPYVTSGRVSSATALMMLGATLVASIIVGGAWHFVARFFDLVLLFPMGAGLLAGGIITAVAKGGLSRSTKMAILCGLLVGPVVYGTKLACNAYAMRPAMVEEYTELFTPPGASTATRNQMRQEGETLLTSWNTFRIYMKGTARNGITLKDSHASSSSGTRVSGTGYWALLGVETLVVSLCAITLLWGAATEPFCENCQKWHGKSIVMQANHGRNPLIADAVRARNWGQFVRIEPGSWNNKSVTSVTLSRCPSCSNATLKTTSTGKFPKDLKYIQLSRDNAEGLVGALQHAAKTVTLPPVRQTR